MTESELKHQIETLELKMMHMENTLQELNEVILKQYRDIEHLQLQQKELLDRSTGGTPSGASPQPIDELPPHY